MSTDKSMFKQLKVGKRVHDVWYGPGVVKKLTQRSAYIYLNRNVFGESSTERYDIEHVNHFIKLLGWKRGLKYE